MSDQPKQGTEAVCRYCGETIRYISGRWKYWPGPRVPSEHPPHVPEPVEEPG